jgi:hypothetical protein
MSTEMLADPVAEEISGTVVTPAFPVDYLNRPASVGVGLSQLGVELVDGVGWLQAMEVYVAPVFARTGCNRWTWSAGR